MAQDLEKLGKDFVVQRFKDAADPYALAGETACRIAIAGAREAAGPRAAVVAACRGVMGGMLLLEKDLPRTAVALLSQMGAVAREAGLEPSDCMMWAMEGIAPICKMGPDDTPSLVRAALEAKFMGAGETFARILEEA